MVSGSLRATCEGRTYWKGGKSIAENIKKNNTHAIRAGKETSMPFTAAVEGDETQTRSKGRIDCGGGTKHRPLCVLE